MKIATAHSTTLLQGNVESVEMSLSKRGIIAATKMFRDSIYTHKPWAVVREILCNAIDEHQKHGIKRPIRVTLPTQNDPHFRVRDFAKGLPKEKVFSVFFQYFESTKDQDNDSIGGFGIGAKSPLAYSDVFFVDSYFGGEKISYLANIDGEASQAHKMALADTQETGIEVSVPVLQGDFAKFRDLVQHFVKFSKFQDFEFVGAEVEREGIAWTVDTPVGKVGSIAMPFRSNSNIYAQIKDVVYVIDSCSEFSNPFYHTVILNIENGAADIHPSRERLDLSKRNIYIIQQGLRKLSDQACAKYLADMKAAKTARDKFKVEGIGGIFRSLPQSVRGEMPEILRVNKNVPRLFWDASSYERKTMKDFVSSRWHGSVDLKPDAGTIVAMGDNAVNTFEMIAWAEKKKLAAPVICVWGDHNPKGWIEGEDFHKFNPADVDKAETLVVRKRYVAPRVAGQARQSVKLDGSAHMGYTSRYRSHYHSLVVNSLNSLKAGITYVLCEYEKHDQGTDKEYDLIQHFTMPFKIVYVGKTHRKNWKAEKLPQGIKFCEHSDFLKQARAMAQKFVDAQFIPTPTNGLRVEDAATRKGYTLSQADAQKVNVARAAFPDLKTQASNPAWEKAQKTWDALSKEDKELVTVDRDYRFIFHNYPNLKDKINKIWERVFP